GGRRARDARGGGRVARLVPHGGVPPRGGLPPDVRPRHELPALLPARARTDRLGAGRLARRGRRGQPGHVPAGAGGRAPVIRTRTRTKFMKITGVESFFVEVPQKPPIAPYHSRYRGQSSKKAILIRLETDGGLVGWGETPQVYLGKQLTGREAEALRPVLTGLDPTAVMAVYSGLKFDHTYIQST